jgi:hypothetical protein
MQIKVKVDVSKLTAALLRAPEIARPILRKEMGSLMSRVALASKHSHRFQPQSGNLERSIKSEVSEGGLRGTVYLDGGVAPYAEYVHEGTGLYGPHKKKFYVAPIKKKALSWVPRDFKRLYPEGHWIRGAKPDRFLNEALKQMRQAIRDGLLHAYTQALQKAGIA